MGIEMQVHGGRVPLPVSGHPSTEGRGTPLTPMQRDSKGSHTQTQNFKLHNFEKKTGEDLWDPTLGNELRKATRSLVNKRKTKKIVLPRS